MRRTRTWLQLLFVLATAMLLVAAGTAHTASVAVDPPRTVLMAGDSLTAETRPLFAKATWSIKVYAFPGTAPCDWISGWHPNLLDLLDRRPAYLFIETAANTGTRCMRWPDGVPVALDSPEFLRRYEAALTTIFDLAIHNGVRIVYVAPPPIPTRSRAAAAIASWVVHGAGHPGVIESNAPREALSDHGEFSVYLHCLANETAAMGCFDGWIAVRTVDDPEHIHFCPYEADRRPGFLCGVYSSGEHRWATAVDKLII